MFTTLNVRRLLAAAVGIVGFGLLMALRDSVSGSPGRGILAGLAFSWGAAAVIWLVRSRP
jgi:hypothetical protein